MNEQKQFKVLAIAGSLRRGSYNRALVKAAGEIAPQHMEIQILDLHDIPLYNADVEEEGYPPEVLRLQNAIADSDALLIATPEYQHGVPGVLKNAIDWASRPPGKAAIIGKPVAIMGATPGAWGTARSQSQLRQILTSNNCPMVSRPEILVAQAAERIDENGTLTHEPTRKFIGKLLDALADLIRRHMD